MTDTDLIPGVEARPVPAAYFGELAQAFGLSFGLDFGRHLSAELAVDGFEVALGVQDIGAVGEYAVYSLIPALRLRYPLADGRVVPYGLAGVGLVHTEFNDRKPPGGDLEIKAKNNAAAVAAGVGVEYFVTGDIAVGLESKYVYSSGHTIKIVDRTGDATIQAMTLAISLRAYLFTFTR
jgi:opacity protein-like surface antigen